jgi:ArsR family transcriptional regulator, arsenate/arsenite/antimonite-responsive transcriptional repressor
VSPSSLTFHVQHLHRAGLITQRRIGRQLIYTADFSVMNDLVRYLTENCCGCGSTTQACSSAAIRSRGAA